MATVTNAGTGRLGSLFDSLSALQTVGPDDPSVRRSATEIVLQSSAFGPIRSTFTGTGFTFDAAGRPTGGTVTDILQPQYRGNYGYGITDIQVPLTTLYAAAVRGVGAALVPGLLSGSDTFQADTFPSDPLFASEPLYGYDGDDLFAPYFGQSVDGGTGSDTVALDLLRSDTPVEIRPGSLLVTETAPGGQILQPATYTSVEAIRFLDGTLSFEPGTTGGQVYVLFQVAFGRAPGTGELGYFTDAASRYGLPAVASGLLATPEGQARLGGLDDAGFVGAVYRAALGRDADPGGLQYWQGLLGGAGRGGVLAGIAATDEAKSRVAAAIAPGIFGADPAAVAVNRVFLAATGALPNAASLAGGLTQPRLYAAEKYLAGQSIDAGVSDADFVASLIRNAYGADASDPGAVAYYTQILGGADTRAAMIDARAAVIDAYASSPGIAARVAPYVTDHGVLHA